VSHDHRWQFMQRRDIPVSTDDPTVYLRRWYVVATPWGQILLHHILLPDAARALHDHPFSFASLILRGGYAEEALIADPGYEPAERTPFVLTHHRRPGRWHFMRAEGLHRIAQLHGDCWTLVLTGPRRRTWGFVEPGRGWVDWRTYLGVSDGVA
jgi:hypothetical protein